MYVLTRSFQPLIALNAERLTISNLISDGNMDWIHVQDARFQLSPRTVIYIDCAHRGRHPAHVTIERGRHVDFTNPTSTGRNTTVFQYEVLGKQNLVVAKRTRSTTIRATRFELLNLATYHAIRSTTRILNTHRHSVFDPGPGICAGMVSHQAFEVIHRLISQARTMKLDEAVMG